MKEWCWWCCHDFPGEPIHFPILRDEKRKLYDTFGNFCSWSCVKAFNLEKHGSLRGGIIGQHIMTMRREMCGLSTPIKSAPSRFALQEFGGPLTIEEFRKKTSADVKVYMPFEIKRAVDVQVASASVALEDESAPVASTGLLVLKRPKPLKRHENSLEKSLGIFKKK